MKERKRKKKKDKKHAASVMWNMVGSSQPVNLAIVRLNGYQAGPDDLNGEQATKGQTGQAALVLAYGGATCISPIVLRLLCGI